MICIYEANTTSWHGNGLCVLQPSSCTVTEIAGGDFSLTLVHPITEDLRWKELQEERIIKAPVPAYKLRLHLEKPDGRKPFIYGRFRANERTLTSYQYQRPYVA